MPLKGIFVYKIALCALHIILGSSISSIPSSTVLYYRHKIKLQNNDKIHVFLRHVRIRTAFHIENELYLEFYFLNKYTNRASRGRGSSLAGRPVA